MSMGIKSLSKMGWIKVVGISSVIMVSIAGGMNIYFENNKVNKEDKAESKASFSLISKEVEMEYGELVSVDPQDYVKECTNEVMNMLEVDLYKVMENGTSIEKIDGNKKMLDVGIYYLVFTHNEEKKEVKINVVDTQAPVITLKKEEVELQYGKKWNPHMYVDSVKDCVDGDLDYVVEGEVNSNKAGIYEINYKAVDKNGCVSKEALKVVVHDKEVVRYDNVSHKEEYINPEDGKVDPDYDKNAGSSGTKKEESANEKEVLKPWTVDEVPTERKGDGDMAFKTKEEALQWASNQIGDENSQWYGCKFMVSQIQKYGQQRLPNDPWAVTFILVN